MSRLCISIPVHEQLPTVIDQIQNVRAWLPSDTVVVLHMAQGFSDPNRVAAMLPDGVYVNPVSQPTLWGDVMSTHNSNFRFISQIENFEYFVMNASNDLYIREGVEHYVSTSDAGVQLIPLHPFAEPCPNLPSGFNLSTLACRDPGMLAMTEGLGISQMFSSQAEGLWFEFNLFQEMVSIIGRYWSPEARTMFAPEHHYYATLAASLTNSIKQPMVYFDDYFQDLRQNVTPTLIRSLRRGTYVEDLATDWAQKFPGHEAELPQLLDYANIYAVKRVDRQLDDPLRRYINALTREHSAPVRLRSPGDLPSFVCLTSIDELVKDDRALRVFANDFCGSDDACMVVSVPESRIDEVKIVEDLAEELGLVSNSAANVVVLPVGSDLESELMLAGIADVVCTASTPSLVYADCHHVRPVTAHRIRLLADKKLAGQRLN